MSVVENIYPVFASRTRANPQALYEQMREEAPVYGARDKFSGNRFWFLTRYEDVVAALKDERLIKDAKKNLPPEHIARYTFNEDPMFEVINRHLLNLDAPDHTRLRSLVHKAFTPRHVRDLEPRIHQIAGELLDAISERGKDGNLIDDFAYPLPITVIAEMLGVHPEKRDDFRKWTQAILFGMSLEESQISVMEFVQYINELIEVRREEDQGDILSALVYAEEDGDRLDHMELLSMVFLLLVAGHETTVNLIANGTLALMQHPDQMALLQENPDLISSAIEEMLRYNGPVETTTLRYASEEVIYSGTAIPVGDIVLPSLVAANRDPEVFTNPNTFDITRNPNPHVAFGAGVHYCLGAPLARMEGVIAIRALVERYPKIALDAGIEDLEWNTSLLLHGMKALPVCYW